MNLTLTRYDDHQKGHDTITVPQLAIFLVWSVALVLWTLKWAGPRHEEKGAKKQTTGKNADPQGDNGSVTKDTDEDAAVENRPNGELRGRTQSELEGGGGGSPGNKDVATTEGKSAVRLFTAIRPPPNFHEFLGSVLQLGVIMFFFFLTDYIKILPKGERIYSRDNFLFLMFLLFLVGSAFTIKPTADKILNRDITEEWKGWMQVLFVWYHYFAAVEWYNWIRVYIAAYVWMTGFGNFSFFWVKKDYSIWRAMKMLFRLNFLVLTLCATVSNEYMLYYICPMHTYWFLSVYAFMGIGRSLNDKRWGIWLKFAIYAVANAIIFEVPGVSLNIFRPFWFALGLNDGKRDVMHEWSFRLGLDHWVCFIGMLCAYNYPYVESALQRLEESSVILGSRVREVVVKVAVCVPVVAIFIAWHQHVLLPMDKFAYNKVHPYLSFIPVFTFILLRNIFPVLRTHYIDMLAWLGKITLETYLSQLHIYLQSNAKHRLIYIPTYPQLNFAFNTIIYLCISHSLFTLTTELSAYLLPKDTRKLIRMLSLTALVVCGALAIAFLLKHTILVT